MTNRSDARVRNRLTHRRDWDALLNGDVDAVHLTGFASNQECAELLRFVGAHPRAHTYNTAAGIVRLGVSFSDARRSGTLRDYLDSDVLSEALEINAAVTRLMGQIASSWPLGVETLTYNGFALHRAIARRISGGGADPHDDHIGKELPEDPAAREVVIQIGVNLYLEMGTRGGELEGWRRSLTAAEYEAFRSNEPGHTYGVGRHNVGTADWRLLPSVGDVVIFRNSELHAIGESDGYRTTWGFFLGYRGGNRPLLVWS